MKYKIGKGRGKNSDFYNERKTTRFKVEDFWTL
jgi:hypothetical protein